MSGTNPYVVGSETQLALTPVDGALPVVRWVGLGHGLGSGPGMPMLGEHSRGRYTRPHLRGHRPSGGGGARAFRPVERDRGRPVATCCAPRTRPQGWSWPTRSEPVPGGGLRCRCTVTNTATDEYVVDGLEVVLPLPDDHVEVLDLTGRHERERTPQRHAITDGLWLREGSAGRPGLDAATLVVAGTPGFSTTHGHVIGVHVGWSGSSVLRVERSAAEGATIGGGELLLPGEVTAVGRGVVRLALGVRRGVGRRPRRSGGELARLPAVAGRASGRAAGRAERLGGGVLRPRPRAAERRSPSGPRGSGWSAFVLDDGWFHDRRDDTAGLGDWVVDPAVWPEGLDPLIEHVTGLGMEFGSVVRAGDGEPGLRPVPRAPGLDPVGGRSRAPGAPAPAGAGPDPARRFSTISSSGSTPSCRPTTSGT